MKKKLKLRIIEKFDTMANFSHEIREHQATVSNVVRGKATLPRQKQEVWAKTLDLSVEDLFGK